MVGLSALAHRIFGSPSDRKLKKLHPIVAEINALEAEAAALDDAALRERTVKFRGQMARRQRG